VLIVAFGVLGLIGLQAGNQNVDDAQYRRSGVPGECVDRPDVGLRSKTLVTDFDSGGGGIPSRSSDVGPVSGCQREHCGDAPS
jgi:hypothetical protein